MEQKTDVVLTITREMQPNGFFIIYCSALLPEDCPQDLLQIMETWDASRAYDEAIGTAARELMARRRAAKNGHPTAPA